MDSISLSAKAANEIIQRISSGELEVHGIILRDTLGKKFRYILKGLQNLPADSAQLNGLSPLEPLRMAMGATQLLQAVTIAQNAAMAASLRRIESRLEKMDVRLGDIERRLSKIQTKQILVLEVLRSLPISRLKAAKVAAQTALQHQNLAALITSGGNAQQAAYDLMEQSWHLVRIEEDGLPVALFGSAEHADLVESSVEAAMTASAMWLALDNQTAAAKTMRDAAEAIECMCSRLAAVFDDPNLLLKRLIADTGNDDEMIASGERLVDAMKWAKGRAVLIEAGLITKDPAKIEFECVAQMAELEFAPLSASEEVD